MHPRLNGRPLATLGTPSMRPLSNSLLRAQRSSSAKPWVRVEALDRMAGIARLRFQRVHTGSEAEGSHALTNPADGALIRARVDPTNNHNLYVQRVSNPSPTADFTRWVSLGPASRDGDVALCSAGTDVLLFSVSSNRRTLYVRASADSGATFGQAVYVTTASSPITWLAADLKPDGTALLLYALDNAGLYAIRRSSGSWGNTRLWSNSLSRINGVAVHYNGDWNVAVAGRDSTGRKSGVWSTVFGDGAAQTLDTWSALKPVTEAEHVSGLDFRAPFIDHPDVDRLFFIEQVTGAHNRPFYTFTQPSASYLDNLWREPAAFDLDTAHGLAIGHTASHVWLSTANGVWSAPLNPPPLDLSRDVVSLTGDESARETTWRIALRNNDGRYSRPGEGDLALLTKGSEIRIGLGYVTESGRESSPRAPVWIDGFEHRRTDSSSTLIVRATGGWGLLAWQQARRERTWAAGEASLLDILRSVLARAGFELVTHPDHFLLNNHRPEFLIEESEPLDMVVERLMSHVPDILLGTSSDGFVLRVPSATEESSYIYGSGHGILEARYLDPVPRHSRAIVFGSTHTSDLSNWSDFPALFDRPIHIHEATLDTQEKTDARAHSEARRIAIYPSRGSITVPVNAAQELYDVIELTDPAVGLASAKRRVLGLDTRYAVGPKGPRYVQTIHLGVPYPVTSCVKGS